MDFELIWTLNWVGWVDDAKPSLSFVDHVRDRVVRVNRTLSRYDAGRGHPVPRVDLVDEEEKVL